MANPRDNTNPLVSDDYAFGREFYIHPQTGRTHVRMPAGGTGGGVTSFADAPATDEQHVAFLDVQVQAKAAESENLKQQHAEATKHLEKKRAEEKDGKVEPDINNPIGPETYGRPQQHVRSLGEQASGPHNPADERDPVGDQPMASPVKETA